MDNKAYALMAILLAAVASVALTTTNANAQTTSVTVQTDKTSYDSGDQITISGDVTNVQAGQPILVRVTNPQGTLARTEPVTVAADGSWTYTFPSGGPLMRPAGEYTVQVTYRGITEETTFEFAGSGTEQPWKTIMVDIGGNDYPIRYMITGGTVTEMTSDVDLATLMATISSTTDGVLTVELPRDVIQALSVANVPTGGSDIDYEVFVDTIPETGVDDESLADVRILKIPFEQGAEDIEIVGTWVIPEFGAIAAIVLAVAIVGIIVATARYGKLNNFVPRL
ncbi:MAG TPA: PEFG-CTERM sorting domain-containing protein [Nitrososphaera sp.]|nr:PEFG-CTERM sorting domain-containing protein [Nitrososphaera sp.]